MTPKYKYRAVDFFVDGKQHSISVVDAPTLTANVLELRHAAGIPADDNFALDERLYFVSMKDQESVVLSPDGTTKFISWPQGVMHG